MLSQDQEIALTTLLQLEPGEQALIQGEGGCGKTFVACQYIIAQLAKSEQGNIAIVAPTHIAKNNLFARVRAEILAQASSEQIAINWLSRVQTFSSASFAGRRLEEQIETGNLQNAWNSNKPCNRQWLCIVLDEISLTPWKDAKVLLDLQCPVVLLGDQEQSQPVKEKQSPIFELVAKKLWLTTQHRQANCLHETVQLARQQIYYPIGESECVKAHDSADSLMSAFLAKLVEAPADTVYLAFTNSAVAKAQAEARNKLYGNAMAPWQIGERLRLSSSIGQFDNGEIVLVVQDLGIRQFDYEGFAKFTVQQLLLQDPTNSDRQIVADVIAPAEADKFSQLSRQFQQWGDDAKASGNMELAHNWWSLRSGLGRGFAKVTSAYAVTVLRSQSLTIGHVFVNTADFARFASNKRKLLYVAYSRASQTLSTIAISAPKKQPSLIEFNKQCTKLGICKANRKQWANWLEQGLEAKKAEHIAWWKANGHKYGY